MVRSLRRGENDKLIGIAELSDVFMVQRVSQVLYV